MSQCTQCFGRWPCASPLLGAFLLCCAMVYDLMLLWIVVHWPWRGLVNIVIVVLLFVLMVGFIHDALLLMKPWLD
jgi:hypothetical protein